MLAGAGADEPLCSRAAMTRSRLFTALTPLLLCSAAHAENPVVRFDTSAGFFDVELCQEVSTLCQGAAPATVANFFDYVDAGDYVNSVIHRSVFDFVIQGGGFRFNGSNIAAIPTDPPVVNEFNQSNLRGTLAMARGGAVNSATSQWFVNLSDDNEFLDDVNGGFTVFGIVMGDGMQVVDLIASLQTCNIRAQLGSAWGETPLNDYPPASCNPPKNPSEAGAPPVDPAVTLDQLIFVFSIPEPVAEARALVAATALAALAGSRRLRS